MSLAVIEAGDRCRDGSWKAIEGVESGEQIIELVKAT